jgi:hypothetical protein
MLTMALALPTCIFPQGLGFAIMVLFRIVIHTVNEEIAVHISDNFTKNFSSRNLVPYI